MTMNDHKEKNEIANQVLVYLIVFAIGWMFGATQCSPSPAYAQESDRTLLLARLCVNESGTDAFRYDDCAAIHAVIAFRAEHLYHTDYVTALHRYSGRATVVVDRVMPWVPGLNREAMQPQHWPANTSWDRVHRDHWLHSLSHAERVMKGDVVARCSPHTWGARGFVSNDHDTDIHSIGCGHTRNRFWSVRRYERAWGAIHNWAMLVALR